MVVKESVNRCLYCKKAIPIGRKYCSKKHLWIDFGFKGLGRKHKKKVASGV